MSVLKVQGLTKRYADKDAVAALSFTVEQGQVFGFLGPNGSGKTTTMGMIFGIIRPSAGTIALFGLPHDDATARRRLGGTLEQPNLYPHLTGRENLRVVAAIKGLDAKCIAPALHAVELTEAADRAAKGYSLGMKQRLCLAAAMLGDPELLIFDEPTNGLDPEGMREIRELISRLARAGRTVLVSSHLLDEVEKICTHVAIINRGRLQRIGSVSELAGAQVRLRLRAEDPGSLLEAVSSYPFACNIHSAENAVFVELTQGGPAVLNRYLADRGVYLSELQAERQSLEQTFLAATTGEAP